MWKVRKKKKEKKKVAVFEIEKTVKPEKENVGVQGNEKVSESMGERKQGFINDFFVCTVVLIHAGPPI
jgi:hypothetical protein